LNEEKKETKFLFYFKKGVKMRAKSGFTLVEILIVVVILGILAAIVIPQFTNASTEARESALVSNLQSVRSQIELYKVQHNNDALPGAGTATFNECMEGYTDKNGAVVAQGTAGALGKYMEKIPVNPFSTLDSVATPALLVRVETGASTAGANTAHWVYNTGTGTFQADDALSNSEGVLHSNL
jgi:general secretion pathway protein G